ncbi:MAG: hypothetical protein ACPG49_07125 [Chitinophagales bacterium]
MATELKIPQDIYNEFYLRYRADEMKKKLQDHVLDFLKKNQVLCLSEGVSHYLYSKVHSSSIKKQEAVKLYCIPFLSEKLLDAFRASLHKDVRTILDELVWKGQIHEDEIREDLGIEVVNVQAPAHSWEMPDRTVKWRFKFFLAKSQFVYAGKKGKIYTLTLLPELLEYLRTNYPKPKNYNLHPTTVKETYFVYSGEKDILLELPRLLAYYGQGNIKLSKKDVPLLSTVNKMQRNLELAEFFENTKDKALKNLRTNAIAGLLVFGDEMMDERNPVEFLKKLFHSYPKKYFYTSMHRLLPLLNGTGHWKDRELDNVEHNYFNLLKLMPSGEWIDFKNLEDLLKFRQWNIEPVYSHSAHHHLYYSRKTNRGTEKEFLWKNIFYRALAIPLLKANFFLFAAFGLVEIAYNQPDTTDVTKTFFSPYDELQSVKLTKLGAFITGQKRSYELPVDVQQTPLVLSEDSLMILSDESDATADILLQNFTQKVGANRYQTDEAIFLKDCSSQSELLQKINLFQQTVTAELPANWEVFFERLKAKVNPFTKVTSKYELLQIPANNQELIQLMARDSVLKNLVLKGEGFHIFVKKTDLTKFKSRLKEFGFLLS